MPGELGTQAESGSAGKKDDFLFPDAQQPAKQLRISFHPKIRNGNRWERSESSEEEDGPIVFALDEQSLHGSLGTVKEEGGMVFEVNGHRVPAPSRLRMGVRFYSEGGLNDHHKPKRHRDFNRPIVAKWKNVVQRALSLEDPWVVYAIHDLPSEQCIRHRYSSYRQKWATDVVEVKIQNESFARGAFRECFRLKKRSNFTRNQDWAQAQNYVAKRYLAADVERSTYFDDVRLQMDAKLWAEDFNRHNPPKKVDIFQITVLEFNDRPGKPLFHLEHFIEGDYIKYNSNSGFVSEACRQTPQAFSHFTFERSAHQLIVVDVQGVGDLYTDPQIHTVDGKEYGDGNLGTKGMALFFYTHACNDICKCMELTPFDLAPTERAAQNKTVKNRALSETVCRGSEESCLSPSKCGGLAEVMGFLRERALSHTSSDELESEPLSRTSSMEEGIDEEPGTFRHQSCDSPGEVFIPAVRRTRCSSDLDSISTASSCASQQVDKDAYWQAIRKLSRPAGLNQMAAEDSEDVSKFRHKTSVLAQVHLDMTRYHELGRFRLEEGESYDRPAAWFHLDLAAKCGVLEAVLTLGRIYLGMPHDLLADFNMESDEHNVDCGLEYMEMAGELGDKGAMMFLADAFEKGEPLGTERSKSFAKSIYWLEKAIEREEESEEETQCEASLATLNTHRYQIQARMAELFRSGGFGLKRDPMKGGDLYNEAAEGAMEDMKGKLANKYYMLAEEAWAEVEEE